MLPDFLRRLDASLACGNTDVHALAEQYGTPLYVYDLATLRRRFEDYRAALGPRVELAYAVKANSHLALLQQFQAWGARFDVVSLGELLRVVHATGDAHRAVFSGVGKTDAELLWALNHPIAQFNVESTAELERLNHLAQQHQQRPQVALRINPEVDAATHPYIATALGESKFGLPLAEAFEIYRQRQRYPALRLEAVAMHIGSQLLDLAPLDEAYGLLAQWLKQLAAVGVDIQHVDLGGGLGVAYEAQHKAPPVAALGALIQRHFAHLPLQVMVEPGRSLVAEAGVLLTRVVACKSGPRKHFVVVDAAMNDLARPALYQAYHHVEAVAPRPDQTPVVADVVGPVCESGDWLARDRALAVRAGELLVFTCAGAYGAAMASNYNTRCRTAEVLIDLNGQAQLITERESFEQLWQREKTLGKR